MTRISKEAAQFTPPTTSRAIRLLEGPQESLERFVEATNRWLDPSAYTIGGGTVLESRWKHRNSEDADLFVRRDAIETAVREYRAALRKALLRLTNRMGEGFQIGDDSVSVQLTGAPVNMIVDRTMTASPKAREHIEGTGVGAQSTEEILAKKLHLRIIKDRTFTPRDFYDMVWCAEREPKTWRRAGAEVTEEQWASIARVLEGLPDDWGERDRVLRDAVDQDLVSNLKERSIAITKDAGLNVRLRNLGLKDDEHER